MAFSDALCFHLCHCVGSLRGGGILRLDTNQRQFDGEHNSTAQQLAQLLVPPWVIVTNASYTGAIVARGTFAGGNGCGLPIDNGVILSTGWITNAIGPNDDDGGNNYDGNYGPSNLGQPGDADLRNLVGNGQKITMPPCWSLTSFQPISLRCNSYTFLPPKNTRNG